MVEFGESLDSFAADPNALAHMAGIEAVREAGFKVETIDGRLRLPGAHHTEVMVVYNNAMASISRDTQQGNISD